jgi:uncharacterized glyoxalase superfamily protein PhnB
MPPRSVFAPPEEMPPQDEPWGERRTYFHDPDGHLIHVAAKLG